MEEGSIHFPDKKGIYYIIPSVIKNGSFPIDFEGELSSNEHETFNEIYHLPEILEYGGSSQTKYVSSLK